MTSEQLKAEESKLIETVAKVEQLEEKMNGEMQNLREKIAQMQNDMKIYQNIGNLREEVTAKKQSLVSRKEVIMSQETPTEKLTELRENNKQLLKQLNDNDTYIQLNTLEKKLELLQETNRNLQNQLDEKRIEVDYEEYRQQALNILQAYNKLLQTNTKST